MPANTPQGQFPDCLMKVALAFRGPAVEGHSRFRRRLGRGREARHALLLHLQQGRDDGHAPQRNGDASPAGEKSPSRSCGVRPSLLTEALFGSFLRVPANSELYKVVFPSALTVTHLALAAAASLALTARLLRRSFFLPLSVWASRP